MNTILNYAKTKAFEFITQFKTLKISVFVSYSADFSIFFLPLVQNQPTSSCQFLKNLKKTFGLVSSRCPSDYFIYLAQF